MKKMISNIENKLVHLLGVLAMLTLTGCESYLEFEKFRFQSIVYVFIGTLVIGFLGMLFSNKNGKK